MLKRMTPIIGITTVVMCTFLCGNFLSENTITVKAEENTVNVNRIQGKDRYETSAKICEMGWKNGSDYLVITSGEDFPDDISAAPLAASLGAPIMINNKNILNINTKNEIIRLKPRNIYIIGGYGAIAKSVEDEIRDMGYNTTRIGGANRYETSLMVAKCLGNPESVFVARGDNFADALSAAAVASINKVPILLSPNNALPDDEKEYISQKKIGKSYLIGGSAVMSDNILRALPNCTRIAGKNGYETNIEVLNNFYDKFNLSKVFVPTGENFPDAICSTALAGINSSPIVLASKVRDKSTTDFLGSTRMFIKEIDAIGGNTVVTDASIDINNITTVANADNFLHIPTYDGSNQSCHPKVLYFENGCNGYKYWMAYTPYPNGNDSYENPSLVASNSGITWEVPKGIQNPIINNTINIKGFHNSDPHLLYNTKTGQLEFWYRSTVFSQGDNISRIVSSDGANWSKPQIMYSLRSCLSPAVIYEDNKYKLWYIDGSQDNQPLKCMYIESEDGTSWSNPVEVNLNLPGNYVPWHIDVVHTDLGYETVFCGYRDGELYQNNRVLFYAVSQDGLTFNNTRIILRQTSDKTAWDSQQIYRSSFVKVNGIYKLFYSAQSQNGEWHIGLTQGYNIDNLSGYGANTVK